MSSHPASPPMTGASVVITHRIIPALQGQYEAWLNEIGPLCRTSEGLLDWHVIRPIAGYTDTYSVIIRYQSEHDLKKWMDSPERERLIAKARPLLQDVDRYYIYSRLDFLFELPSQPVPMHPVCWKQFLLTWSACLCMDSAFAERTERAAEPHSGYVCGQRDCRV
ncbi:hypothetical protein [Methylophilus aquaticus]|uniref:Antibiotic biosynthesis monooxygenase n=1 Tax=Methylophilus aquaticus TaxID=1971610 RepID=A0ABT9JNT5_9PROT|nr:hypothetical protein [Methylophilus aquaticus]MDP8566258.1 hypothetical protein [Methylophilus aquaticus]